MRRRRLDASKESKRIFLVIGSSDGCGTTHTAFLLAYYFWSCRAKRVCYIEMNGSDEVNSLAYPIGEALQALGEEEVNRPKRTGKSGNPLDQFHYHGLHIYCNCVASQVCELLGKDYEVYIVDGGNSHGIPKVEVIRPDEIFVVCDGALWKTKKLEKWLQNSQGALDGQQYRYLIPYASGQQLRRYGSYFGEEFLGIPYNPIPYNLRPATIKAIQKAVETTF